MMNRAALAGIARERQVEFERTLERYEADLELLERLIRMRRRAVEANDRDAVQEIDAIGDQAREILRRAEQAVRHAERASLDALLATAH